MANIKSAKKRISTIQRRRDENKFVKATLATLIKKFRKLIEEGKVEEAEKYSKEVYSYIDSACSKGVIHKNTASRKVGRLAEALFKAKATKKETTVEAKPAKVETKVEEKVEVKAEEKKAPAKKAPAKKTTTTKKETTKKEAIEEKPAKKTTTKKVTKKAE